LSKKIIYITDLSLPSSKAQAVHIFKMIDNLLSFMDEAFLIFPRLNKEVKIQNLKKHFNIHTKKKIHLIPVTKKNNLSNSFSRLVYGLKVAFKLKKETNLIISRSLISSFFLTLFKVKHFLEIHQELKGLTKFLFISLKFINSKQIIKIIFISKGLSDFYKLDNKKFVILHDACDLRDFRFKKKINKNIKNIYYIGSFYKGRGISLIKQLANLCPEYNFHLYGLRDEKIKSSKNFKVFPFKSYSETLDLIKNADLLLMPYQSKISINSINFKDDISRFISPLKMFEYLASSIPLISSDLKVLREILVNENNSILIKNFSNALAWKKAIKDLDNNFYLRKKISKNSILTAKNNTWEERSKKIYKIFHQYND
jgi:glycosyltransferase involved in cell wall biosynthesis